MAIGTRHRVISSLTRVRVILRTWTKQWKITSISIRENRTVSRVSIGLPEHRRERLKNVRKIDRLVFENLFVAILKRNGCRHRVSVKASRLDRGGKKEILPIRPCSKRNLPSHARPNNNNIIRPNFNVYDTNCGEKNVEN